MKKLPLCLAIIMFCSGSSVFAIIGSLSKIDSFIGTGKKALRGKTLEVHYTGWLYDASSSKYKGKKFDSSRDRKKSFSFKLGSGKVIRGWEVGFVGMREGGKRTLIIPAHMGYGIRGSGDVIPPNSTLVFDVELIKVQ